MPRRPIASLLVLLALVALAGCGGGGSDKSAEFKKGYAPLNDQVLAIGNDLGNALSSAKGETDIALARQFASLTARARRVKTKLEALDAPGKYQAHVAALARALDRAASDLERIAGAARAHDATGARTATEALVRDSPAVRNTRRAVARDTGTTLGS
jgi:hypothetical protein